MSRKHPGTPPSQRGDRSPDWRETARKTTQLVVQGAMLTWGSDPVTLRDRVTLAAREALSEKPTDEMERVAQVEPRDAHEVEVLELVSMAGIFRYTLENTRIDHRDPMLAESFMAVVVDEIDRVLEAA